MSLLRLDADDLNRPAALREFGHALGFLHEEQNSKSTCRSEWASTKDAESEDIIATTKPTSEISDSEHTTHREQATSPPPAPDNGNFVITNFDKSSVMRVYTLPKFFWRGEQSECYAPAASNLSAGDKLLIRTVYPPKPPDVSGSLGNQTVIRMQGPLAADHYSYLIEELYKRDLLEIRKTILNHGTVNNLITSSGSTIRNTIPDRLGKFLCSINQHNCSLVRGQAAWRTETAKRNHVEDGTRCPSHLLQKHIVCIPNVRIESYTVSITTKVRGGTEPLKDIVVSRYRGCSDWSDECKTLILRMNTNYDAINDPGLTLAGYSGKLELPAEAYRMVLTFRNENERREIETAVGKVRLARSKMLKLPPDEISIAVTYPLASVEAEQVALPTYSKGTAPIKPALSWASALNFKDEFWSYADYDNVDVGVWDNKIDKDHCGFKGTSTIVFDTPASRPAQALPPDNATSCPTPRENNYLPVLAYDHGTAVAGIISGVIAGESAYYGVKPRTPIWAYDLANVDQINQGGNPLVEMYKKYRLKPKVINISLTFNFGLSDSKLDYKTHIESYMFSTAKQFGLDHIALIVAAAGATRVVDGLKKGSKIDNVSANCNAYPACWGNVGEMPRALISVVALNESGTDLLREEGTKEPLSNYGMAFDVAAVGETSSLLHGGYMGRVRGSSFAAPFITGLAALVYSKAQNMSLDPKPLQLKNRILATADKLPEIEKFSRFGRVNFWKAMKFENDLIRYRTSVACPETNCWKEVEIDRDLTGDIKITEGHREGTIKIDGLVKVPFSEVLSLRKQPSGKFTIIYTEGSGKLRWVTGAQLDMSTEKYVSLPGTDTKFSFDLSEIEEFAACSFKPGCPDQ